MAVAWAALEFHSSLITPGRYHSRRLLSDSDFNLKGGIVFQLHRMILQGISARLGGLYIGPKLVNTEALQYPPQRIKEIIFIDQLLYSGTALDIITIVQRELFFFI